jgi:hypothetical protein
MAFSAKYPKCSLEEFFNKIGTKRTSSIAGAMSVIDPIRTLPPRIPFPKEDVGRNQNS